MNAPRMLACTGLGGLAAAMVWVVSPTPVSGQEGSTVRDLRDLTRKRERPQERTYDTQFELFELDYSYDDAEIRRRREAARVQPRQPSGVDLPDVDSAAAAPVSMNQRFQAATRTMPDPGANDDRGPRNWILPPQPGGVDGESGVAMPWEDPSRERGDILDLYRTLLRTPDQSASDRNGSSLTTQSGLTDPTLGTRTTDGADGLDPMQLLDEERMNAMVEEARRERLRELETAEFSPVVVGTLFQDEPSGDPLSASAEGNDPGTGLGFRTGGLGAGSVASAGGQDAARGVADSAEADSAVDRQPDSNQPGIRSDEAFMLEVFGGAGIAGNAVSSFAPIVVPVADTGVSAWEPGAGSFQFGPGGDTAREAMDDGFGFGEGSRSSGGDTYRPAGDTGYGGFTGSDAGIDGFSASQPVIGFSPDRSSFADPAGGDFLSSQGGVRSGLVDITGSGARNTNPFSTIDEIRQQGSQGSGRVPGINSSDPFSGMGGAGQADDRFRILMR